MSLLHQPGHDDQQLARYLLGLLPEEEAERLDELSVADEEVTWRLRAVENDLVDAYVSGALAGETMERFESFYLSSPLRRDKVRFAASFLRKVDRRTVLADRESGRGSLRPHVTEPRNSSLRRSRWLGSGARRRLSVWGLAGALAAVLIACGALLFQDFHLRDALESTRAENTALARRTRELEQQLRGQRSAAAQAAEERARTRTALEVARRADGGPRGALGGADRQQRPPRALATVVLVLAPQTRSTGEIATVAVPQDTERVAIELQLTVNDFPGYQAVLKDPRTDRTVWRSGPLAPKKAETTATVSVLVPASLLRAQHYSIELSGPSGSAGAQVVEGYTFRVVPR